jgi:hypothetical protein
MDWIIRTHSLTHLLVCLFFFLYNSSPPPPPPPICINPQNIRPQLYVNGEFIGGTDIVTQMHESGELKELLEEIKANEQKE